MPIVINSRSCSNAGFWAKHLQKTESNERVELVGFYGLSAETIEGAFREMRGMAQASDRCKNYFSQYNINPRADEHLTEAQWEEAHALHRKNHGLDHLPYFRVRHIKDGRVHEHGIALRVDPDTGRAISDSLTAAINERTSRELEIRFGLERGQSVLTPNREQERRDRRPRKHENFRAERSGIDPEMVKADARAARHRADNGQSFRAALEESGAYILARGDRRDFVIIDSAGDDHSLARRLGMKTAELRAFMADLDPASLPSVAEAKAIQEAHRAEWQRDQQAAAQATTHGNGKRKRMATGEDMDDDIASKQRQERQAAEDRQAAIYNDMVADRNRADRFILEWQRDHDNGARDRRHLQEAQWRREAEQDITDVRARALLAAGESRDFVQAVRREGSMITQEHAGLQRDIALEKDPDKKQLLELKRDIQHADYMALANERIAAMSNLNGEQYKEAMRQQEVWSNTGTDLRKERLELQERMADRDAATISQEVAERMNAADRQRAEFRADIRGNPQPEFQPEGGDVPAMREVARLFGMDSEQQAASEAARKAAGGHKASVAPAAPGEAAARPGEPERPAEIIYISPSVPERREPEPAQEDTSARRRQTQESEPVRENTDTRQNDSAQNDDALNAGITDDAKAAKKAALAQYRADIEQSIAQGQERGYGNSR